MLFPHHQPSPPVVPAVGANGPQPLPNSVQQRGFWQYEIPDNNPVFPVPNQPNTRYMILGPGEYPMQSHIPNQVYRNPRQQPFYLPHHMSPKDAFGNLPGYLVFVYQPPELYHEMQSSSHILKDGSKKRNEDVMDGEDDFDMGDLSQFHIECEKVNPNERNTIRVEGFDFACRYSLKQFGAKKKRVDVTTTKKPVQKTTPKPTPKPTTKPATKRKSNPTPKPATMATRKAAPSRSPKAVRKAIDKPKKVKETARKPIATGKKMKKGPVKRRKIIKKRRKVKKGKRKPRSVPNDEPTPTNKRRRHSSVEYIFGPQDTQKPCMEFLVHQFLSKIIYRAPDGTISAPNHFFLECNKRKIMLHNGLFDFYCTPLRIFNSNDKAQVWGSPVPNPSITMNSPNSHIHGAKWIFNHHDSFGYGRTAGNPVTPAAWSSSATTSQSQGYISRSPESIRNYAHWLGSETKQITKNLRQSKLKPHRLT
ncbi:hypothetical protein Trydic_g15706 [Trypoxylus dichotomus]